MKIIGGIVLATVIVAALGLASCQSNEQIEFDRYYSSGSLIYQANCQNCHGKNGEGLQQLIPSLNDTGYLKTNQALLSCAIKNGLKGKITIKNKTFDGQMPAQDLAPIDLASVITYVTNSFGNKMGTATLQQVETALAACR